MTRKVIVGGTFDHIHIGHQRLLKTALKEGETTVGLVSDEMLEEWKPDVDKKFEERKKDLEDFLSSYGDEWNVVKIDDPYRKAVEGDYDVLVVSYETIERGKKINEMRKDEGKEPLKLVEVPPVLAEDFLPAKSTRIRQGDIDKEGSRLTPVKLHLGSKNPTKRKAVESSLSEYFEFVLECSEVNSIVDQPVNEEIIRCAEKRAEVPESFDYGIGVESGIVKTDERIFSLEYVVIKDRYGFKSAGHGPGFPLPEDWKDLLKGDRSLTEQMKVIFSDDAEKRGSVDLLTKGKVTREDCIKTACDVAMIPRLNFEIYRKKSTG